MVVENFFIPRPTQTPGCNKAPGRSLFVLALCLLVSTGLHATENPPADLLIRNARIITVTGPVIDNGSIAIIGNRIELIDSRNRSIPARRVIDAQGQSILPGMMDVHRHLLPMSTFKSQTDHGANSEEDLQAYIDKELPLKLKGLLANGLTTILSATDPVPEIYDVREKLQNGDLLGPRLLATGRGLTAPGDHPAGGMICESKPFCRKRMAFEVDSVQTANAAVRQAALEGADFIKVVIDRAIVPNSVIKSEVLEAVSREAEKAGIAVIVHALSVPDMIMAIDAGADKMVHAPILGSVKDPGVLTALLNNRIPVATTVAFMTPAAAKLTGRTWNEELYRQLLSNIRQMINGGVVVAFGTDSPDFLGETAFYYEIEALGGILSTTEVIETLTIQAARYLGIEDRLGSLEVGKVADLVMLKGNPLADLSALKNVSLVLKNGKVAIQDN